MSILRSIFRGFANALKTVVLHLRKMTSLPEQRYNFLLDFGVVLCSFSILESHHLTLEINYCFNSLFHNFHG